MHSPGETYQQYHISARRFENQHRSFEDVVPSRKGVVNLVEDVQGSGIPNEDTQENEGKGETEAVAGVNQCQGPRCLKCGSNKHDSGSCNTEMSRLRCFKCNQLGHASLNCKVKKAPDGKSNTSKGSGKSPQKGGSSGKGSNGSGKGKKGKMFAVLRDDGTLWYSDATGGDEAVPDAPQDGANDEASPGVLVLNCILPQNPCVVDVGVTHVSINCCSSDASLEAGDEIHAVVTCDRGSGVFPARTNEESPHFIDVFDMAHDNETVVDMSPIYTRRVHGD